MDSAPNSKKIPDPDEITPRLEKIAARKEFQRFREHSPELQMETISDSQELSQIYSERSRARAEAARIGDLRIAEAKRRRFRRSIFLVPVALLAVAGAVYVAVTWIADFSWLPEPFPNIGWGFRLLLMFAGLLLFSFSFDPISTLFSDVIDADVDQRAALMEIESKFSEQLDRALNEGYTRAINRLLGGMGMRSGSFPTDAPRLVELNTANIAPSRSISYIKNFIKAHEASSIGVAGPRGIGKSTLMSAIESDQDLATISRVIPAPVRYEGFELLRRIALSITEAVVGRETTNSNDRASLLPLSSSLVISNIAILVGIAAIVLDFTEPFELRTVGALSAFGLAIIILGTVYVITNLSQFQRPKAEAENTALDRARSLRRDLAYESQDTEGRSASFNVTSYFGFERSKESSRTTHALTHADLTHRLRALLTALGREEERTIVLIDELDKLPSSEALIESVNALKDLFRVANCYFVLSVSDEAMASFTMRGIDSRDAFDSSFDIIIRLERLTIAESLAVLDSRIAGFPPELARLCHVWSGGLPRDLLRGARSCIEVYNDLPGMAVEWPSVGAEFLRRDLTTRLHAVIRGNPKDDGSAALHLGRLIETWLSSGVQGDDLGKPLESPYLRLEAYAACSIRAFEIVKGAEVLSEEGSGQLEVLTRAIATMADNDAVSKRAIVAVGESLSAN
jgi:hypothetical protein